MPARHRDVFVLNYLLEVPSEILSEYFNNLMTCLTLKTFVLSVLKFQ